MKILLVPPIMYLHSPDLQPHMGLCSLQSILREHGYTVEIISLLPRLTGAYESARVKTAKAVSADFYNEAMAQLLEREPDLIGFSTVGASYPTTLVLIAMLKAAHPGLTVVLGGIQATLCGRETMLHFPAVDYIVAGEAERSFPVFLRHLRNRTPFPDASGVYYRTAAGEICYTGDAPLIEDLDTLPMMDYCETDLSALSEVSIDVGRGCPFQCYYCCTNNYWKRTFRLRSPRSIISEIEHLYHTYGKRYFVFNHDLLTCNRAVFRELLTMLQERGLPIRWRCSSRIDTLDENLLREMAAAGCYQIFFGIESGSRRMQRVMKKHLDPAGVLPLLDAAAKYQIRYTASFICGLPEERWDDLMQTVELVCDCIARDASVQIHLLAPFQGTEVYRQYRDHLRFDGTSSNVGSSVINNRQEEELIEKYPHIFCNFYYIENPYISREMLRNVEQITKMFPYFWRTLGVLRYTHHIDFGAMIEDYLRHVSSLDEMPDWVRRWMDTVQHPSPILDEVFAFETAIYSTRVDEPDPDRLPPVEPSAYFRRRKGSRLYPLPFDPHDLEESIRLHRSAPPPRAEQDASCPAPQWVALISATCRGTSPHYNAVVAHSSAVRIYEEADGMKPIQAIVDEAIDDLRDAKTPEQVRESVLSLFRQLVYLRLLTLETAP